MIAKKEITLRVTITDEKLMRKIRSISQPERGRVIQRALSVYFETAGGKEVYEIFAKGKTKANAVTGKAKPPEQLSPVKLKDLLGEF